MEVIVALPRDLATVAPVTRVRSTFVLSSQQGLKERGHYERYVELLPRARRDELLLCVAGVWLPMELARMHYDACDRLGLPAPEQVQMGMTVSRRTQRTVLATASAMAKGAGVTPWTILPQFARLWGRALEGGGVGVTRIGPKEAKADFVACELFGIRYFRNGFRGILLDIVSLFCARAYVHDQGAATARHQVTFLFQWV